MIPEEAIFGKWPVTFTYI